MMHSSKRPAFLGGMVGTACRCATDRFLAVSRTSTVLSSSSRVKRWDFILVVINGFADREVVLYPDDIP